MCCLILLADYRSLSPKLSPELSLGAFTHVPLNLQVLTLEIYLLLSLAERRQPQNGDCSSHPHCSFPFTSVGVLQKPLLPPHLEWDRL